jgi:predicted transcriptional regulator
MQIQLDDRLVQQLEAIARQQERTIEDVIRELVEAFLQQADFRAKVREAISEHKELLDKLAEN